MADLRDIEAEERALVSYALHNMDDYTITRSSQSYDRALRALERAEALRREAERLRAIESASGLWQKLTTWYAARTA
jgi:hypothetical protein